MQRTGLSLSWGGGALCVKGGLGYPRSERLAASVSVFEQSKQEKAEGGGYESLEFYSSIGLGG